MSEVKRYATWELVEWDTCYPNATMVVLASDYDALAAREAMLREFVRHMRDRWPQTFRETVPLDFLRSRCSEALSGESK